MTINNENEFCKFIKTLLNEKRITRKEYDALNGYVCGIFDALSGLAIYEEDLM